MSDILCHFFKEIGTIDPNAISTAENSVIGKTSHPNCLREATVFVRVKHTRRLCPLCPSCVETFETASQSMNPDVKKNIPGHGEYGIVSLIDGSDEFAKQTAKQ